MTTDDITKLRALLAAATPGPWDADLDVFDGDEGIVACVIDRPISMLVKIPTDLKTDNDATREKAWQMAKDGQELRDATLIASAVNALGPLLDEIERLRRIEKVAKEVASSIKLTSSRAYNEELLARVFRAVVHDDIAAIVASQEDL